MVKTEICIDFDVVKKLNMYNLNNADYTLGKYEDSFIQQNFKNFKPVFVKKYSHNLAVCFNYALDLPGLLYCEDAAEYLWNHYNKVNIKEARPGDVVAFADDCAFIHFARIIKTGNSIKDIIVRAKFGHLGIYEHKLLDTPIDFGDRFVIYRKKYFPRYLTK